MSTTTSPALTDAVGFDEPALRDPGSERTDLLIGGGIAVGAAILCALAVRPDWEFDVLVSATAIRNGSPRILVLQHGLPHLLPYAVERALAAAGHAGGVIAVMAAFGIAFVGIALACTFLAARRFGAGRPAAAWAVGLLAVTAVIWRAGADAGVYGAAYAAVAVAWLAAARYVARPDTRRAAWLGVAVGAAVATHLANLALAPAAMLLVALTSPSTPEDATAGASGDRDDRLRRVVILCVSGALAAFVLLGVVALVASRFSVSGALHWLTNPEIGKPGDRSRSVGWGVAGMFDAVASGASLRWLGLPHLASIALRDLIAVAVIGFAAARGMLVLIRHRTRRATVVAGALLLNAALAFAAASWYQALRGDYWGFGLIPLAIVAVLPDPDPDPRHGATAIGARSNGGGRMPARWVAIVAAVSVLGLALWNYESEVRPVLAESSARTAAVAALEREVPRNSLLITSLDLSGRLSLDGYVAESGWVALSRAIGRGAARPGLTEGLTNQSGGPVYVTDTAFALVPDQVRVLGATADQLWSGVRSCCDPARVVRLPDGETLYRLGAPPG